MIKINPENINYYYDKVNELIDQYFEWDIRPSALRKYMKRGSYGMKNFIDKNDLSSVKGIERVIEDVVEDRYAMEKDGVLTFESFENIGTYGDSENIDDLLLLDVDDKDNYKKVLADYYKVSFDSIQENDDFNDYASFNVSGIKLQSEVRIYSNDDLEILKERYIDYITKRLMKDEVRINFLGFRKDIEDLFDESQIKSSLENNIYNDELIRLISNYLKHDDLHLITKNYKGYLIWER